MAKKLRIVGLVLIFCASDAANSTAGTNVADCDVEVSTVARDNSEADAKDSEGKRFSPAECFDEVWGIINDEFWTPTSTALIGKMLKNATDLKL
jgi:hypothetical protein